MGKIVPSDKKLVARQFFSYFRGSGYPQYGWDFPEEILAKFRKDPGNALRAFPVVPLQSLPFSISLLFSFSDFPCLFGRFFLSFPRFLGASAKRKTLAFFGVSLAFFSKKARVGGSGLEVPSRVWLGSPRTYNSRHFLRLPKHESRILSPPVRQDASFF